MNKITNTCSLGAGKIWHALNTNGPLTDKKLLEITQLTKHELYCGLGWLAREDKIRREQEHFHLGETNLTPSIGKNAGKIWLALDIWGQVDYLSLKRLAQIEDPDILAAIGWLARENKIDGNWPVDEEPTTTLWLK